MTTPTHGLSVNIYGRGDASLGDGPPHMGIAIYTQNATTCEMHHIRNPTDEDFIYDPRPQPLEDPVLKGRCELAGLSSAEVTRVSRLLLRFGNNKANIPEFGVGNCQDWVAGAVGMLEKEGVVGAGEGAFWRGMINRSSEGMRGECIGAGKRWIPGPGNTFEGEPDARFGDGGEGGTRAVGKLGQNEGFQVRMQQLLERTGGEGREKERGYYVSSPFFSRVPEG
ncbi:hypothetical protein BDW59DRAFT_181955 [Aspergillus cavernicola]|uniref:Uncharacterized protein n=1 Tax=Aspergillus cavernicola TaxID=176166 RepID=A0ABR4HS35_9EURO